MSTNTSLSVCRRHSGLISWRSPDIDLMAAKAATAMMGLVVVRSGPSMAAAGVNRLESNNFVSGEPSEVATADSAVYAEYDC